MKKKSKSTAKKKNKKANPDFSLREHLVDLLKGGAAHVNFLDALENFPEAKRGTFVTGLPHTAWQLLEHLRIAQWDILEFSRNPKHVSPGFPEGYWPQSPEPPDAKAWDKSIAAIHADRKRLVTAIKKSDLLAPIPHANKQSLASKTILVIDHNAYHLGQLILLRRLLEVWPEK